MIKPGTPVRVKDLENDTWDTNLRWLYVGPLKTGGHVCEAADGRVCEWRHVERTPRKLVKGDIVYVDDDKTPVFADFSLEFIGMFEEYYVVKHADSNKMPLLFRYAIHIDDLKE